MKQLTPLEYIKIAIANAIGLDKLEWDSRLEYANHVIAYIDGNGHICPETVNNAKEPLLLQKACNAYYDAINGVPTGFIMGLDATASGIQILSILSGCVESAKRCNLINVGSRVDSYGILADHMGMSRSVVKPPGMTYFFGSKAEPREAFGDDVDKFYSEVARTFPGCVSAMEDIQSCWQSNALSHSWTARDGHNVIIKNMIEVIKAVEIDELEHKRFNFTIWENTAEDYGVSLVANITHSIDGYIVREMSRRAEAQGFDLLTTHDNFWASPNHMQRVRQNYLAILIELAKSDELQTILRQITGNPSLEYIKISDELPELMKDAEYPLS